MEKEALIGIGVPHSVALEASAKGIDLAALLALLQAFRTDLPKLQQVAGDIVSAWGTGQFYAVVLKLVADAPVLQSIIADFLAALSK